MGFPDVEFLQGTALVVKGESMKASCYVSHLHSLGVLREKIVTRFVREAVPQKLNVETGLIHSRRNIRSLRKEVRHTSRQCDVLIHDAREQAPLYRWDDFVVVSAETANAVVEVKSVLGATGFSELDAVTASVSMFGLLGMSNWIPTFAYALREVKFPRFVERVRDSIINSPLGELAAERGVAGPKWNLLNCPVCIAVLQQNYVGVRPVRPAQNGMSAFLAVDLNKVRTPTEGISTGYFLHLLTMLLTDNGKSPTGEWLFEWFNKVQVAAECKKWVTEDGKIHTGNLDPSFFQPRRADRRRKK